MAAMGGSVARRYARALFEIGVEKNTLEPLGQELAALATVYADSAELRETLLSPVFRPTQKRAVLEQLVSRVTTSPLMKSFALKLLDRRRINLLPSMSRCYGELMDAQLGQVRATVVSATPLDAAALADVKLALERRTQKKVLLQTQIDPSIIGGVIARVGDLLLDGSLRTQLETLRSRVLN